MSGTNVQSIKLFRRFFALVLILALLAGGASAEISGISLNSFSTEKLNVYVRAFVPGSKTPWKSVGHYDLMIEGVVSFRGKIFVNPVFSYRMEDSCLDVFNEADTGKVYPHSAKSDYYYDCDIYQCRFTLGDYSDLKAFLKALNGMIASSSTHSRTSAGLKCRFKSSSVFSKYKTSSTNCFYAVALWMKGFGNDSLLNYYYGAHTGKYEIYLPKNLVRVSNGRFKLKYAG